MRRFNEKLFRNIISSMISAAEFQHRAKMAYSVT